MTEYALQILESTQQLVKCYEITEECPKRTKIPPGRIQAIITDTQKFNDAVAAYEQYGLNAHYSWDGSNLDWEIV
jgi:hypothetical protein